MKRAAFITAVVSLTLASSAWANVVTHSAANFATSMGLSHPGPAPTLQSDENETFHSPLISTSLTERKAAARAFIMSAGLDKNLSLLLLEQAKNDAAVQAAIEVHGFQLVKSVVVEAIQQERLKHKGAWREILVDVYAKHFGAAQLKSIARERDQSPYFEHLVDAQQQIADAVQQKGATTLAKANLGVHTRIIAALGT